MNDTVAALTLALGSAWTAGINLYATVAALGLAAAVGAIELPPGLQALAHPAVIAVALVLYVVEFVVDKVPFADSAWDAVHTFIRVPAGAILAARALGPMSPELELIAFMAGGGVALSAHAGKAALRVAINASPEPVSNWLASLAEDVTALAGIWMIFNHPLVMLTLVAIFVVAAVLLVRRVWRALVSLFRRGRRGLAGAPAGPPPS
jgi:hypothetical protein